MRLVVWSDNHIDIRQGGQAKRLPPHVAHHMRRITLSLIRPANTYFVAKRSLE